MTAVGMGAFIVNLYASNKTQLLEPDQLGTLLQATMFDVNRVCRLWTKLDKCNVLLNNMRAQLAIAIELVLDERKLSQAPQHLQTSSISQSIMIARKCVDE
jgi:hypothetical protein